MPSFAAFVCSLMTMMRNLLCSGAALIVAAGFAVSGQAAGSGTSEITNTNRFGFNGPEIFPIDAQITQLRVADLDGDGLNDLVVVNNARARINLLYNQTGKTNLVKILKPTGRRELNELPADSRFRIDSIASE